MTPIAPYIPSLTDYHVCQKKNGPQKYYAVQKYVLNKILSLMYKNCHIIYLSLAKNCNDFS